MFVAAMGSSAMLWSSRGAQASWQAEPRPTPSGADGRINIRAFGAQGDRTADDLKAIRQAIAAAAKSDQYPASVFIPAGNFRRGDSIALPNHICLFGEGVSSILNSQNDRSFDRPILINAAVSGLISARLQDLTLYGGSHGIKLDAEQENADLRLQNVGMLLQSVANIEANKLLQTTKIINCVFGSAPYGIKVSGTGTNCLIAIGSEWIDHSEGSIFLRGADGVTIVGGRFEGGGRKNRYCIDIENASNILFVGCFFENVHEYLARFRYITGSVVFESCHFSGTSVSGGPLQSFKWDIADSWVVFRDCLSVQPMGVGGQITLEGGNHGIFATDVLYAGSVQSGRFLVQPRDVSAAAFDLITIQAGSAGGDWQVQGSLTIVDSQGPADASSGDIPVIVSAASESRPLGRSDLRLVRRDATHWAIVRASGTKTRLGWAFRWDCTGAGTPPSVAAALTR
ncbi:Pectate lyase superfamily protein [Sphingomonas sp. RIT328]|nr:Pectate lyase superfamily protein [Sphingomonas sp. RIT328]